MFKVYVLHSPSSGKIYIGYTSDLDKRILSHNNLGINGWTIKFRPWNLIYTETFLNKNDAIKREKKLKSFQGRLFIRSLIT